MYTDFKIKLQKWFSVKWHDVLKLSGLDYRVGCVNSIVLKYYKYYCHLENHIAYCNNFVLSQEQCYLYQVLLQLSQGFFSEIFCVCYVFFSLPILIFKENWVYITYFLARYHANFLTPCTKYKVSPEVVKLQNICMT